MSNNENDDLEIKKLDAMNIDVVYLPDGKRSYDSEATRRQWELFGKKELYESLNLEVPDN